MLYKNKIDAYIQHGLVMAARPFYWNTFLWGLTHSSFVSAKQFCDNCCKVILDKEEYHVYYEGYFVLIRSRKSIFGFWVLPMVVIKTLCDKTPTIDDLAMIYHEQNCGMWQIISPKSLQNKTHSTSLPMCIQSHNDNMNGCHK